MKKVLPFFLLCMLFSALALLFGLWAGLLRLGWDLPVLLSVLPLQHGPLMISGFLGTLISLERVAAIRKPWMFAAPLLSGLGWVLGLLFPALPAGGLLILAGSLVTTAILGYMVRREPRIYIFTMAVGMTCWVVGNLLWISGVPIYRLVGWWAAFLVLTIAGERLELSRIQRLAPRHFQMFTAAASVFLLGAALTTWIPPLGARISGLGMLLLCLWLLRYDIARRNLRSPAPLTRFIATCLFSGYFWLGLSGVFSLGFGAQSAGGYYDAILHTVFVGFVFSMIFGHAPIILPALAQINITFDRLFYLPLVLLHSSLVLRILSDLAGWSAGRKWGGILNEIAILAFLAIFAITAARPKPAVKR